MNRAVLVTVLAAALALSGCSMFRSEGSSQRSEAPAASQPSAQSAQPAAHSAAAQRSTRSSTNDYDAPASGTSMKMSADELRQAQQKLKDDGDYTGQVDGKMGPKTAQALKKFQKSNGLPQTGRLDHQTASKLGISMSGSSQPSSSSSRRSTTSTGSAGTGTTGTGSTNQ